MSGKHPWDGNGPACGTVEAAISLDVIATIGGVRHEVSRHYCCHQAVPAPDELFPKGTRLLEVVLVDSLTMTTINHEQVPPAVCVISFDQPELLDPAQIAAAL